jgi:hypothetical protein
LNNGERWFGMVFTSIGIGLLILVFYLAFQMFTHSVPGLAQALAPASSAVGGSVNAVGGVAGSIAAFLLKLAVLFIMTLAGSHIAARGIQLYHGGTHPSAGLSVGPTAASKVRLVATPDRIETAESADLQ